MNRISTMLSRRFSQVHWVCGLTVALMLMAQPVWSVNLYQGSVRVVDQNEDALSPAIREALDVVVVKLSGRQSVLNQAPLREALDGASSLVQQYQYLTLADEQKLLQVQFQKPALDALLTRYGVPVWGRSRPELVVWLAVDDGNQRLIAQPETHAAASVLEFVAGNRGIPLLMPLLDLEDRRNVSFNDVWGGFGDRIENASRRYAGEHILMVRLLRLSSDGWHARWSLQQRRETQRWQSRGDDLNQVLGLGFAQVADFLAAKYAPKTLGVAQQIRLAVSGIQNIQDFARISNYLSSLDRVEHLSWNSMAAGEAIFELKFSGESADLEQLLALNRLLVPSVESVLTGNAPIGSAESEVLNLQPMLRYQLKQ